MRLKSKHQSKTDQSHHAWAPMLAARLPSSSNSKHFIYIYIYIINFLFDYHLHSKYQSCSLLLCLFVSHIASRRPLLSFFINSCVHGPPSIIVIAPSTNLIFIKHRIKTAHCQYYSYKHYTSSFIFGFCKDSVVCFTPSFILLLFPIYV